MDSAHLLSSPQSEQDRLLAARYAPYLAFDAREPFMPLAAGYTLFRESGPSPSFRQGYQVELAPPDQPAAHLAIEYAIWWDWDIGHLYELEHVWVYVSREGRVVRVEASWHGGYHDMRLDGALALQGDHPLLYSEPGKHAFAPSPTWFLKRRREFKRSETQDLAGVGGILLAPWTQHRVAVTPLRARLVHTFLSQHAFEPAWEFSTHFGLAPELLVPWPALCAWIPERLNSILARLEREIPPSDYRFLRIGHRGAVAHAPHNTLLAIRTAAALRADMVELDLQRTVDGHVVLSHDPWLVDAQAGLHPIRSSTLAELRAIDLGQGERIPTLLEAVNVCREEQLGAYLEIKDGGAVPPALALLREEKAMGHCILASFRPDWLAEARALAPELVTSVLFGSPHLDAVALAQAAHAAYVHPCWERYPDPSALLTPEWVGRVRKAGLGIICWHEERPEIIAALRRIGVDGICSDAPELLIDR